MRPKKPRYFNGIQLADNLYSDKRNRVGYWRYRRLDSGKDIIFQVSTVQEANQKATELSSLLNAGFNKDAHIPTVKQLAHHLPLFFEHHEKLAPKDIGKKSWQNRKNHLRRFADQFLDVTLITHEAVELWWDELTPDQQKARGSNFRKCFNFLMKKKLCTSLDYNPFTKNDAFVVLERKPPIDKARLHIDKHQFDELYLMAGKMGFLALQIAMSIGLYTTLRVGDLAALRFSRNIIGQELRVIVSKSEAQKGTASATRLGWAFAEHPKLWAYINESRKLAKKNDECPYILSHKGKIKRHSKVKEHQRQILTDTLSKQFRDVRDVCGYDTEWAKQQPKLPSGESRTPFSFHEIRGLSITMLANSGFTDEEIAEVTAHESVKTTQGYQNADDLPYMPVRIQINNL